MSSGTKRCPYCDEKIRINALKCKHCGSMLTETLPGFADAISFIRNALAARYEVMEEIGRGGMSIVYKAVQKNLKRTVALKILPQHFMHDREFLERFHREARSAAQLNHPNIITIYDEGIDNGVHYMAMEYITGKDLHTIIRNQGAIPPFQVKSWLLPVINGLYFAHSSGIIHRDIKSSNILVDRNGRAVLMDFGIVRGNDSAKLTQTGSVLGTPEYMSPEQAKGLGTDVRSDIYSMGVVLYESLTGRLPFKSDTLLGTLHMVTHDEAPLPRTIVPEIPEAFESIVMRCLARNPTERFTHCEELSQALTSCECDSAISITVHEKDRTHPENDSDSDPDTSAGKNTISDILIAEQTNHVITPLPIKKKPDWLRVGIIGTAAMILFILVLYISRDHLFNFSEKRNESGDTYWNLLNERQKGMVTMLIRVGDSLFVKNKLISPPEENAYDKFQQVLKIHQTNTIAKNRLQDISKKLCRLANSAIENKKSKEAAALLDSINLRYADLPDVRYLRAKNTQHQLLDKGMNDLSRNQIDSAITTWTKINLIDPKSESGVRLKEQINDRIILESNRLRAAGKYAESRRMLQKTQILGGNGTDNVNDPVQQKTQEAEKELNMSQSASPGLNADSNPQTKQIINSIGASAKSDKPDTAIINISNDHVVEDDSLETDSRVAFAVQGEVSYKNESNLTGESIIPEQNVSNNEEKPKTELSEIEKMRIKQEISMKNFVHVQGGSFMMGCDRFIDADWEKPKHKVTLNSYYIGKYEVTQKEWHEVLDDSPFHFAGQDLPVEKITWRDAIVFCNKKSEREGLTPCYTIGYPAISCNFEADGYRLPTEAEWEYAALGGIRSKDYKFSGGNDLFSVAWFDSNSNGKTHPVGQKQPNELGLFDMSGNVWEWCWDSYDKNYYKSCPATDPKGANSSDAKVRRGGSWDFPDDQARSRSRNYFDYSFSKADIGLRLVRKAE